MRIITAALPYANGFIHLGHIASTFLPADIYARFCRLKYKDVVFVSATDEHGTPIEVNALKYNLAPLEFVKIFRKEHFKDLKKLGISFDIFYHTHSPENEELVKEFYKVCKEKGLIYEKEIEALYCEHCKRFLPDRFVKGKCPYCSSENQYGDVCEVCGRTYTAKELIEPKCIICGNTPVIKKTNHLFFALSKLQECIRDYVKNNRNLQSDAKNYALSWIKDGLKDIDITRDTPYFGFSIPDMKDKYFYVWVDAPFGYIASTMAINKSFKEVWKNKDTEIVHFMGKDIVYFHYIYWVGMLIASGYTLPKSMPVRGYLTLNKKKMSKSRGNFIYLRDLLERFNQNHVRYYFARNIPDNIDDGDFSYDLFKEKVNKELIGIIGNLGYRMMKIAERMGDYGYKRKINLTKFPIFKEVDILLEEYHIKNALDKIVEFAVLLNEKFNDYAPWKIIKENPKGNEKLDSLFEEIAVLFALLEPYLPEMVSKFYDATSLKRESYEVLSPKGKFEKPIILVEKIDEEVFDLASGNDIFSKVDLRIGKITDVENIEKSDKLYYITLDVGGNIKHVVAGLKRYYTPEELKGKSVVFVNNLKKARIFGRESEGMLLAASSKDGNVVGLAMVDNSLILPGSEVILKGIFKNPAPEIDIEEFRKIPFVKEGKHVYYKGIPLYARSTIKEEKIVIDRYNDIEDGMRLW